MKFVFFGTSAFAVPSLDKLVEAGFRPSLVVAAPPAPQGRGLEVLPSPVERRAKELSLHVATPETLKGGEITRAVENACGGQADLFVVVAYGKLIPPPLLALPKRGTLNVHPSLLPRWRGPDPIRAVLLAGDLEAGVTVMLLDEEVDHGPLLKSVKMDLQGEKWTFEKLERKLAETGGELLTEVLPPWLSGAIEPQEQDHSQATYTKKITKEDGRLDWSEPAEVLERKVRALNPWPGTFAFWDRGGKRMRLRILEAETAVEKNSKPGAVVLQAGGLLVGAGKGALELKRIQPEGKRPMKAAEFVNGYADIVGAVLS